MTCVNQVRADFTGDFLAPQVYPVISEQCTTLANELRKQFSGMLSNGWSEQDISGLKNSPRDYMQPVEILVLNMAKTQKKQQR
jgi:hypothetical protein